RLREAVEYLNAFPNERLPPFVQRIVQTRWKEDVFTREEEKKLSEIGGIDENQVKMMVELVRNMFMSAGKHRLSTEAFAQALEREEMSSLCCSALVQVWMQEKDKIEERLIEESVHEMPTLMESSWRLHVTMADNVAKGHATPVALFQMKEKDGKQWHFEMDHGELHSFLEKMDAIQAQLDQLAP
ncbi:hypothetical protein THRCLA_22800, partial [Thraustotheca clavata]